MLIVLSILLVECIAGLALFSFIQPVTRSRYEEITSIPIDETETWQQGDKTQ